MQKCSLALLKKKKLPREVNNGCHHINFIFIFLYSPLPVSVDGVVHVYDDVTSHNSILTIAKCQGRREQGTKLRAAHNTKK